MLNKWGKSNRAARQTAVNSGRSQPKEEPLKLRLAGDRRAAPRRSEEQPMQRPSVRVGSACARPRGKPALERADWRPCLRNTCFALNKSPPNSKGLPTGRCPSPATRSARVFLETGKGSRPQLAEPPPREAAGAGAEPREEQGRIVSVPQAAVAKQKA